MRRLGMAVSAILLCATVGFARENRNNVSKEPFAINFEKLSYYLQLTPSLGVVQVILVCLLYLSLP